MADSDPHVSLLRSSLRIIFLTALFNISGNIRVAAGRFPFKKAFYYPQYQLFKANAQQYDHCRPGKQICHIQMNLGKIKLFSNRVFRSADDLGSHAGLPAHAKCQLETTVQKRSKSRSVNIEEACSPGKAEHFGHLQKFFVSIPDTFQGAQINIGQYDQKTHRYRQIFGTPPDQQKHNKRRYRYRLTKHDRRFYHFLKELPFTAAYGQH